jgi:hypothetical protein
MTREEWFELGVDSGWLQPACLMHDFGEHLTEEEMFSWLTEGEDPCVPRYITLDPADVGTTSVFRPNQPLIEFLEFDSYDE